MITAGFGLLSLLRVNSSLSQWVGYQILVAAGVGVLFSTPVFPILAPLPVERTASALAFFTFVRSFANTWGITISSTILQNELKKKLPAAFTAQFPSGTEIAYAAIPVIRDLPEPLKTEVQTAFADSLRVIWLTMIGICALGVLSVLFMGEVPMKEHTDEAFGLSDKPKRDSQVDEEKGESDPVGEAALAGAVAGALSQ